VRDLQTAWRHPASTHPRPDCAHRRGTAGDWAAVFARCRAARPRRPSRGHGRVLPQA
jgi:hypothetical protein